MFLGSLKDISLIVFTIIGVAFFTASSAALFKTLTPSSAKLFKPISRKRLSKSLILYLMIF